MRIDRIHIDRHGPLNGSFELPSDALGVWPAPNGAGKSALASCVVQALFGPDPRRPQTATGCVRLEVSLDEGGSLVVQRDLSSGSAVVATSEGVDVTKEFHDPEKGLEPGTRILGLARDQFERTALLRFDELGDLPGNPTLRGLPGFESAPVAERAEPSSSIAAFESPEPTASAGAPEGASPANQNLEIIRSVDAMYFQSGAEVPEASDLDSDLGSIESSALESSPGSDFDLDSGAPVVESALPGEVDEEIPDPDEAGIEAAERLRRMHRGIEVLGQRLQQKSAELRTHSDRLHEVQGESDRLDALLGPVPSDPEEMRKALAALREAQERLEALRIQEAILRRSFEERGVSTDRILQLEKAFGRLEDAEREFLGTFRETETVRRGNLALLRSESRLEESRVAEIDERRRRQARLAVVPLVASALALFGSVLLKLFPVIEGSAALVFAGIAAALVGTAALFGARRFQEPERRGLVRALEHKCAQVEELEKEGTYRNGRLQVIAGEFSLADGEQLLEAVREWEEHGAEIRELQRADRAHREAGQEVTRLQADVGSVHGTGGESGWQLGPANPASMEREYSLLFELKEAIQTAEESTARVEAELTQLEVDRSELVQRLRSVLEGARIDPDRDLEEAIEIYARRSTEGSVPPIEASQLSLPATSPTGTDFGRDLGAARAAWCGAVSARTEAIARLFVAQARELEVAEDFSITLKIDPGGSRLTVDELAEQLSPSAREQVCLALHLAIVETLNTSGERIPLLLDDPLIRMDDERHDRTLEFLVSDCTERMQVVLLTAQAVRWRSFLERFPQHGERVRSIDTPIAATPLPVNGPAPVSSPVPSDSPSPSH